jgi:hypothetical protein
MTVEQSPEHNRFVDESIPFTWGYFFRQLKLTLPVWGFGFVCLMEMGVLRAWSAGRLNFDFVLTLLGACLFLGGFIMGALRLQLWFQHRSKRILRIKKHWVSISPARRQFLPWKHVAKFQFEPLPELPGASKLKLFSTDRARRHPVFVMVLADQAMTRGLIDRLQDERNGTGATCEIAILEHPELPASPSRPFPILGLSLGLTGMYFLLHGMPLLMLSLTRRHNEPATESSLTPEVKERLGRWIASHFSTVEDWERFILLLGLGLSFVGLILLFFGWRLIRIKPVEAPRHNEAAPERLTLP